MDDSFEPSLHDKSISIHDWSPKIRISPIKKMRVLENKDPHITKKEFREIFTEFMKPRGREGSNIDLM
jgi:hypothetical protein